MRRAPIKQKMAARSKAAAGPPMALPWTQEILHQKMRRFVKTLWHRSGKLIRCRFQNKQPHLCSASSCQA